MRVKEPSKASPEKAKRSKRPPIPHDEDSSDDVAVGFTCQHISHAVSVHHVKKAIAENLWSVCLECVKERRFCDGQPVLLPDIWLCLKCGFQETLLIEDFYKNLANIDETIWTEDSFFGT